MANFGRKKCGKNRNKYIIKKTKNRLKKILKRRSEESDIEKGKIN